MNDEINNPKHYNSHPSGVECITITEHMTFCIGNAIKYLWRAGLKDDRLKDLKKAKWYIDREIGREERKKGSTLEVGNYRYHLDDVDLSHKV